MKKANKKWLKEMSFQRQLIEKLQKSEEYQDASIYTILLDLVSHNDPDDVSETLFWAIKDLKKEHHLLKKKQEDGFSKAGGQWSLTREQMEEVRDSSSNLRIPTDMSIKEVAEGVVRGLEDGKSLGRVLIEFQQRPKYQTVEDTIAEEQAEKFNDNFLTIIDDPNLTDEERSKALVDLATPPHTFMLMQIAHYLLSFKNSGDMNDIDAAQRRVELLKHWLDNHYTYNKPTSEKNEDTVSDKAPEIPVEQSSGGSFRAMRGQMEEETRQLMYGKKAGADGVVNIVDGIIHLLKEEGNIKLYHMKNYLTYIEKRVQVLKEKLGEESEAMVLPLTKEEWEYQYNLMKEFFEYRHRSVVSRGMLEQFEKEGLNTRWNASAPAIRLLEMGIANLQKTLSKNIIEECISALGFIKKVFVKSSAGAAHQEEPAADKAPKPDAEAQEWMQRQAEKDTMAKLDLDEPRFSVPYLIEEIKGLLTEALVADRALPDKARRRTAGAVERAQVLREKLRREDEEHFPTFKEEEFYYQYKTIKECLEGTKLYTAFTQMQCQLKVVREPREPLTQFLETCTKSLQESFDRKVAGACIQTLDIIKRVFVK